MLSNNLYKHAKTSKIFDDLSICGMFGYPVLERFGSLSNDDPFLA